MLFLLTAGCFMPASIQNRVNERDRDRYRAEAATEWRARDQSMAQQGWVPAFEAQEGGLVEDYDESDDIRVTLPSTGDFAMLAICGANCIDMDLVVYNAAGQRVAADLDPDARPIVQFSGRSGERFNVRVTIPDCRAPRAQAGQENPGWNCVYFTKVYKRR